MARKKGTPAGEQSRKEGGADQRFRNSLDKRAQEKKLSKALQKLRKI